MASTSQESQQSLQSTLPEPLPEQFSLDFLRRITNNFSSDEKLGESVFGTVYKGTQPDKGGFIAVKKLDEINKVELDKVFATEVTNLKLLKHQNIVRLLGSCKETHQVTQQRGTEVTEYIVCYEYLENGSLDKYLYDEAGTIDWEKHWEKRFKTVKGICQGLKYLHAKGYAHMNLVPSTIWLDDNWEPKMTNFGITTLCDQQNPMRTEQVLGHYGYMAPEYLYKGEISTQLDIYSLGMLIIEIATGQKISADDADKSARNFVEKVRQDWKTDDQIKSKRPSLDTKRLQQVKTCIAIGLKCVEVERKNRPSVAEILDKLEGKRVPFFDEGSGI